jgi:uncharacterized protein YjiS (DUF1127 family)
MATVPKDALLRRGDGDYMSGVQKGRHQMSIRQKIARFAAYHRTVRELSKLNEHELRDVGITRGDIDRIARGGAF